MSKSLVLVTASATVIAIAISLIPASLSLSPVSAAVNLIQNPGFEQPIGNGNQAPTQWTASTTAPYRSTAPNVHSGNQSAYLHGVSGSYTQTVVSISTETTYMFEAYSRALGNATETVTLTFRDSSGGILDSRSWSGSDHGWARRVVYVITAANAWDAVITLGISGNATGEAWFDDIALSETSSPQCFIATAASGADDSRVETLRTFRDDYLASNPAGRAFVSTYYKLSPPVAEFIDEHPALKPAVRVGLLPAVALSTVAVSATLTQKLAMIGLLVIASMLGVVSLRRKASLG